MQSIFGAFATARKAGSSAQGFAALQEKFCEEAPDLIRFGQITIKDAIGLLSTLDDKTAGEENPDEQDTPEAKMRNFLTSQEKEPHHRPKGRGKKRDRC